MGTNLAAAALMLAALLTGCAAPVPPAVGPLQRAEKAMGGAGLKTLRYGGSGTGATFGQAWQPGQAWPQLTYSRFSRAIDYDSGALREDFVRTRAERTGGGALPLMGLGEQRMTGMLLGDTAWNVVGANAQAAPVAVDARIHDLWTTPHGLIKIALRNAGTTVRMDGDKAVFSVAEPGRFSAVFTVGPTGLVERVDSLLPNPVLGDTRATTLFTDYRDFGGVRFPSRIRQSMGGFMVLDLDVTDVQGNAAAGAELPAAVPDAVRGFTERAVSERVADGVWFITGGSHNSVLIEMRDHVVLVEAPLYDGRAEAVLAEVRRLVPRKELRYVINSHHHFDHAGGLRAAVAQGATLVTSELARPWFTRVLANPNGIRPDAMARAGAQATVIGVDGQRTLSDGGRSIDVYMIEDSVHAQGFMMVHLPRERLLIQADAFTPGPPVAALAPGVAPPPPNANNVNLLTNIERLSLQVDRILPLHGRIATMGDLYQGAGRRP